MKNWILRIFLFVLLLALGFWWRQAAQSSDYGHVEGSAYLTAFVLVLLLNIGNAYGDWRTRKSLNQKARPR
ncbi:hypothetical protein [Hymenobacter guriensis]|uniref:Uncharacterized protein n=1 Tax=Hymenobacter guriensis TaxID=2793065 RepID=A0ABS0KYY9_9BACT|nr:hypothetical protein [Hymenobacter guriensis]MBG8553075.1 hypothetical protein [Hymenobacter guriensis]